MLMRKQHWLVPTVPDEVCSLLESTSAVLPSVDPEHYRTDKMARWPPHGCSRNTMVWGVSQLLFDQI